MIWHNSIPYMLVNFNVTRTEQATAHCIGSTATWDCCSSSRLCDEGQGHCSGDYECAGDLVCGKDNCNYTAGFSSGYDCCVTLGIYLFWGLFCNITLHWCD